LLTTRSPEETQQFGERLAAQLRAGDVVALIGDLGSGKTTMIQGLARGLGLASSVKSPTFVLLREYPGLVPLVHIDGYRLEGESSVVWLDVEWVFSPRKITVIEWADRFEGVLPDERLELRLAHRSTNQRSIALTGHGARAQAVVRAMQQATPSRTGSTPKDSA